MSDKLFPDLHVHTHCSDDAEGSVETYIQNAIKKNLTHIAFTNHLEYAENNKITVNFKRDIKRHLDHKNEVETARQKYAGYNLKIYNALEVENLWPYKNQITEILDAVKPDFIVSSVHWVDNYNISSELGLDYVKNNSEEIIYNRYFDEVEKMLLWIKGSVFAHFDIIKRYGALFHGEFRHKKFRDRIKNILNYLYENNIALEINCSGLFQAPKETYPGEYVFNYLDPNTKIKISLGSDSHNPSHLGRGIKNISEKVLSKNFDFFIP